MFKFPLFQRNKKEEIYPEEILIDSHALGTSFSSAQFEGRLEKRVESWRYLFLFAGFLILVCAFSARAATLQVRDGEEFAQRSQTNKLDSSIVWAHRGVIYDRVGELIAWNEEGKDGIDKRTYVDAPGLAHVLGFVSYPQKDDNGYYYETDIRGVSGVEQVYDPILAGVNGQKLIESNVLGEHVSESTIEMPRNGDDLRLTIDADIQSHLYSAIENLAERASFEGGGAVIMDSFTGEIIALTSYPEYSRSNEENPEDATPYLNRATQGLYTPGSIVKPFVALAALTEGTITPTTHVLSAETITVPNPYNPDQPTIFHDWKALGMLDVVGALAHSPNSFFFAAGGGYGHVEGVGITKLEKYMKAFGIGEEVGVEGFSTTDSVVPNPKWKEEHFEDGTWRLGDTYLTSIGQYGFQVTPLHMARAIAAIANDGYLVEPTLSARQSRTSEKVDIDIDPNHYRLVRRGMRRGVLEGTAKSLNVPGVSVAAKTGTAELGMRKEHVNSWVVGFFPESTRRYTFALVMEKAPRSNVYGATLAMREVFEWMSAEKPEYLK